MTTLVSSHRTADEIFHEYSTTYNNNIKTWVDACVEVGTLKETLEYQTQCLYTPLLKDVAREALDKIKDDFSKTRERLLAIQKQIQEFHPELSKGIVDIKKAIEAQAKQDLSGLDMKLQEQAQSLALLAKQHLQELEYDEKHVTLLEGRFAKRMSSDAEARWYAFNAAYDARVYELNPQPKQAGLIARWLGYAMSMPESKAEDKSLSQSAEISSSNTSLDSVSSMPSLAAADSSNQVVEQSSSLVPPRIVLPDSSQEEELDKEVLVSTPKAPLAQSAQQDFLQTPVNQGVKGGDDPSSCLLRESSNHKSGATSPIGNGVANVGHSGKGKHHKGRH
jgi:hypothetical protein